MKQIIFFLVIVILVSITSCKDRPENKDTNPEVQEKTEEHHYEADAIQLNDGKKWKANIETTEGIKKMQELVAAFTDKQSTEAYSSLKENLETEFTTIFEKCTMKGEAHNQLHNYLKPMLVLFDSLVSSNLDTSKKSYQVMDKHLSQYNSYFE